MRESPVGEGREEMAQEDVLRCERHGAGTRLTCAECGVPICPRCMVRTDVGLRCENCAAPSRPAEEAAAGIARRLAIAIVAALAGIVVVLGAIVLIARSGQETPGAGDEPARGRWSKAPALQLIRGSTSAVTLRDGRVAVVGGGLGSIPLDATEIFDPATRTWSASGKLNEARRGHVALRLRDGRVLVAGGIARGRLLRSAEIFHPQSRSWTKTAAMNVPRLGHTMTLLPDGRVLVAGGTGTRGPASEGSQSVRPVASAEIFDPATRRWTPVGGMVTPRFEHTSTELADGRVLIAGGLGYEQGKVQPVAAAELFDPATGTFTRAASMQEPRTDHAAAAIEGGLVFVLGGDSGRSAIASAEVYDAARGTWSKAASLRQARRGHSATVLGDGTVVVVGGEFFNEGTRTSLASAERYDPREDVWSSAGRMRCFRSEQAAALLRNGHVLIVAGDAAFPGKPPVAQSCVELYVP